MHVLLLILLILAGPSQAAGPVLTVQIEAQPQLVTFLGFYDTVFPLDLTVLVTNTGSAELPPGNLSLRVDPPSKDRYSTWLVVSVPELSPGSTFKASTSFRAAEPGVHTITAYSYSWPGGQIQGNDLRYNYTVIDFRGPEIVYGSVAAIVIAIVAILAAGRKRG